MESVCFENDKLVGLRVVRGPNWQWDTQDGGEGFVGTVVGIVKNIQISRRVEVRWDSGKKFIYRIGDEDAYDLRVFDNSTVGVKHLGVECKGCGQKDIAGMRWQCFDCPTPFDLCTFCFTNGKHDQRHVNFRRYHHQSSDPIFVHLDSEKRKIPLKRISSGALVTKCCADWKYRDEDGGYISLFTSHDPIGKVVPLPTGREMTPGKVWVKWPRDQEPYSYRVGFNGKMDLSIAKAGIGEHYQPDTLPVLVISKPMLADVKTNDIIADDPFVVGERVKYAVGLEELREMVVDSGMNWVPAKIIPEVNEILIIREINNKNKTARVVLANHHSTLYRLNGFGVPLKAMRRLIPWLPVGAVVQVIIDKQNSNGMDMEQDVTVGDFGRVNQVSLDGKTVDMNFFTSGRNVKRKVPVSQLQDKFVDVSVIEKVESIRKDLAKLLLSEVEKGSILSVQFLLKNYPNIIDCQSPYDGKNSTSLSVACQKGNLEMVKLLLKHKASVDIADVAGGEEENCDKSDEDDDGSDDDSDDDDRHYRFIDESNKKSKPIHHAVIRNHPELLQLLLQNGASPNEINGNSRTPLHLAAMKGHVECVRVLLGDERCDLDLEDCNDDTAFRLAVRSSLQSVEFFNLFRATGKLNIIERNKPWSENLLHLATEQNNFGAAKFLLSFPEGKKLACECDRLLRTPLFIACYSGHNQIAKLLVSCVDKDEKGKPWGITPDWSKIASLMTVVQEFNYELIEFLIGAGANLQATDKDGDTPFHHAARLYRINQRPSYWPNQETAPEIFKLFNELEMNHPGENLLPDAAIICYLVAKGGIPQNITFPEIKKLIGDDFLYSEIIKYLPGQLNSMSQNFDNQGNPLQYSQSIDEWSETNGAIHQNTVYGCHVEIAHEIPLQSNPPSFMGGENNSSLRDGSQQALDFSVYQDTGMVTGDSASSVSQQQPFPSSQQQSNTFHSFPFITSETVPGTVTSTGSTAANTITTTSSGDYLNPSDNNGFIPATTHVSHMGETISNQGSMSNDQSTADTSNADPVIAASTRPPEELTCTIEEKHFRKRKGGPTEEKTSWIIIDEFGRRYSQQKKDVSDIFQCTANVSTPNKPNGSKKCKGTIDVKDLAGKIEEWKSNNETKFTCAVRNAHEEHLPSKRGRQSTETESDVPSTSNKRKKKT